MKKSRFSESQVIFILKQAEAGTPVPKLCRGHGMSSAWFYKWRSKYGGPRPDPHDGQHGSMGPLLCRCSRVHLWHADYSNLYRDAVRIMLATPNTHEEWKGAKFTGQLYIGLEAAEEVDTLWAQVKDRVEVIYALDDFDYGSPDG